MSKNILCFFKTYRYYLIFILLFFIFLRLFLIPCVLLASDAQKNPLDKTHPPPINKIPISQESILEENQAPLIPKDLPLIADTSLSPYTPDTDKSPNGIEIVQITAPNPKGISNNYYLDFNVNTKGLILNNSIQSITPTQLGGFIGS
ncbi:filamentous hemagglutinin N-terminal domain-containing protein, partial [Helicobacter sp. 11S03491-1]|uniref:filamentous hemagglutinin N-terminal domain-containing protein n=1 Tax=Helicobacter sp. 11S03491-1 TaxID=1476196 RepID=UPI00117A7538